MEEKKPRTSARSGWRTFGLVVYTTIKWIIIFILIFGLFGGGAVTGYVASLVKDDPVRPRTVIESEINENALTGFVYFNNGELVGQLRTEEDRRLAEPDEIPQQVIDALLSVEDSNFFEHKGVDINGFGRAVKQKLLNEANQTGGSTLTQQLARRVFLSLDVTDARKFKEIFLSFRMERYLTKPEILTAYLNKMPFGNGSNGYQVFGIKAAAEGIFDITDLSQLNIAQSAYLAGLPQLPSLYSAYNGRGEMNERNIERAIERQRFVLSRMLFTERISQQQYDEAVAFDIRGALAESEEKAYSTYPYLMLEAERQASEVLLQQEKPNMTLEQLRRDENYGTMLEEARQKLLRGGYHVHTTIDPQIYQVMQQIAANPDNFSPDNPEKGMEQTAAMLIDHKTGAILGMIEGRDFYHEQMNYATQMTRQPGSAMKPIAAYLPAIDAGLVQPASIIDDAPIVLRDYSKGYHIPKNYSSGYDGLVTAREALNRSLNLPALKIFLNDVTIEKAWEFVRKLGVTTLQPQDDAAQTGVIGGLSIGVTVEELTNAYGAIANHGVFNDAFMVSKIVDADGNEVYAHKAVPERVVSEQSAFLMTDMLRTVVSQSGSTGHSLTGLFNKYGEIPIAGKTGTTQNYGDVWFMGYTPDVTLGVWVGYEKQKNSLTGEGRSRARLLWAEILNQVTDARSELFKSEAFEQPDGIVKATVSSVSGKRPTDLTRQRGLLVTDWFNEAYVPTEADDALVQAAYITYNGVNYIPHDTTPEDFVQRKIVIKRKEPLDALMDQIQEALKVMPASDRRPLGSYMPRDAGDEAPSKTDPRTDDGATPAPPANVRLAAPEGGTVSITFNASPESDVVGYRLYRSINGAGYSKIGDSISAGSATSFSTSIAGNSYRYYVTAVDVAGRESAPSRVAELGQPSNEPQQPENGGGTTEDPNDEDGNSNEPNDPGAPNGGNGAGNDGGSDGEDTDSGNEAEDNTPGAVTAPGPITARKTETGVRLSWKANDTSQQVTSYNVYYSADGGSYTKIGSAPVGRFDYISTLESGWFQITAVNAGGESERSAPVQLK
ncbi:transglycosylase domain-containing protein [Paenibacillus sp. IB182496]|uniref:Transglycosylase domain-containing protein n=1 Tax=Paenibacillus sabuli TaxID=2772509 RepID=A0A927GSE8_9BACL|nr:transglycosylase domain-containing protein [Paenibacillus sabuli]MBD2846211.1 transglycosylase domain-containing protein [Paenibacillus sabuli]